MVQENLIVALLSQLSRLPGLMAFDFLSVLFSILMFPPVQPTATQCYALL